MGRLQSKKSKPINNEATAIVAIKKATLMAIPFGVNSFISSKNKHKIS